MSIKWAVAATDYNTGSTWNDGIVPTSNDDVYLNGKIVTCALSTIVFKSLSNYENVGLGIVEGGTLRINTTLVNSTIRILGDLKHNKSNLIEFSSTLSSSFDQSKIYITGKSEVGISGYVINLTNPSNFTYCSFYIIGDTYGSQNGTGKMIYSAGSYDTFHYNIIGSIIGGKVVAYQAISYYYQFGNFKIIGNVYASDYAPAILVANVDSSKVDYITGNIYGTSSFPAVSSCVNLELNGFIYNNGPVMAIDMALLKRISIPTNGILSWRFSNNSGGFISLSNATDAFIPAVNNVRSGITFGSDNRLGTLAVPAPNNVLSGVSVDNTVGSLIMTPSDFITALKADTLGERLGLCATSTNVTDAITNIEAKIENTKLTASAIVEAVKLDALGQRLSECATTQDVSESTSTITDAISQIVTILASLDINIDPAEIITALKLDTLGQRLANCSTVQTTGDQIQALNN